MCNNAPLSSKSSPSKEQGSGSEENENFDDHNNKAVAKENNNESMPSLKVSDLFDPSKPWVLVPDGNMKGIFHWVPRSLRVGPWCLAAVVYLAGLWCVTLGAAIFFWQSNEGTKHWWPKTLADDLSQDYPKPFSVGCWYQTVAFFWMAYILRVCVQGPAGKNIFATFTIQSWCMLTFRHGLCAVVSWLPLLSQYDINTKGDNSNSKDISNSNIEIIRRYIIWAAEITRFPSACSTTITFLVWNFAIFPFALLVGMKTKEQRENFIKFVFSFRLVQLHIFNIVFCFANQVFASPSKRLLLLTDFYVAFLSTLCYMTLYLLIFDRLGIHLYPVFSPRAGNLKVIASWTLFLASYWLTFLGWKQILMPNNTSHHDYYQEFGTTSPGTPIIGTGSAEL